MLIYGLEMFIEISCNFKYEDVMEPSSFLVIQCNANGCL